MRVYLIDASFLLKAILNEDASVSRKLERLFKKVNSEKAEVISQKFLMVEVANGIRYGQRDITAGMQYFKSFLELPIKYLSVSKSQYKTILEMSYKLGTTVYDTSCHVLAKAHNATFLTCDEDYYEKAKILGDIELVK